MSDPFAHLLPSRPVLSSGWEGSSDTVLECYHHPPGEISVQRVIDFMHEETDRNPTLADFAALSGLSATRFARAFRSRPDRRRTST